VKIGLKFQSLGKISNISTSEPPVLLDQLQRSRLCYSLSSVTLCRPIVAKRCFLEQKLLLTAYRKLHTGNRLVPK